MNFKLLGIVFMVSLYFVKPVSGQNDGDMAVDLIIESLADRLADDFDYTELTVRLNFYHKHPININKASRQQLSELIFLSPLQINALTNHIKENGDILELSELQSIEGFDLETIRKFSPFVSVGSFNSLKPLALSDLTKKGNHDLMFRFGKVLQAQQGYLIPDTSQGNRYLGSPARMLLRYRYHYGQNLTASFNMEKDAGEPFIQRKRISGFDFYSGNIFFKNVGRFTRIALGDYSLQFGQGLSLWSGLGIGKGAEVAGIAKQDMGLRPYTSSNEALFFRGGAATVQIGKLFYTPFVSYNFIDGALAGSADMDKINSINISGLHRTPTEKANKSSASQLVLGNALQYDSKNLDIGLTAYYTEFNHAFEKGRSLYNQFNFSGKSLTNTGINYSYTTKNNYFFGEASHSLNSGFALLNGVLTSLSPKVSSVFLYRNYSKNYHSFYNQAFSEGTTAINEKGFYSGLVIKPLSKLEMTTYFDVFTFPWMKFRVDAPSKGYELSSQLVYTYSKKLRVSARYRLQVKEENDEAEETVNTLEQTKRQNLRIDLNFKVGESFTLRNRAEVSEYKKGIWHSENGYLAYQDLIYNPMQSKLSGNFRFAIFDTPGFDSRIYAYENDVLYSYSSPAYQNSGVRYYFNIRYTLKKGIDLWAKYSLTSYTDLEEIGSGLDMINGNKKSEIKLQLRYQF
ncbi:MAG TPA: helix-hairpin-helix domain-containing protein [Sphingobacteriaceae bacterium]